MTFACESSPAPALIEASAHRPLTCITKLRSNNSGAKRRRRTENIAHPSKVTRARLYLHTRAHAPEPLRRKAAERSEYRLVPDFIGIQRNTSTNYNSRASSGIKSRSAPAYLRCLSQRPGPCRLCARTSKKKSTDLITP